MLLKKNLLTLIIFTILFFLLVVMKVAEFLGSSFFDHSKHLKPDDSPKGEQKTMVWNVILAAFTLILWIVYPPKGNVLKLYLTFFSLYWGFSLILYIANRYNLFGKERVPRQKLPPNALYQVFGQVVLNLFLASTVFFVLFSSPTLFQEQREGIGAMLLELFLCWLIQDVCFYVIHRLLHTPISGGIHKVHHQWLVPIGFTAYYLHPLESYSNAFAELIGICLFVSKPSTAYCWLFLGVFYGILGHAMSGQHDFHHKYRYVNFSTGLTDRLMGTHYKGKAEEVVPPPKWVAPVQLGVTVIAIGVCYFLGKK